ncbi:helix-turn-helix domain-containing protein [Pedobacter sp. SL55]|uniref:helix-turn-helix domain-containing protein n=1 Tax=Pedobacter sp. SL55 TaxID=2995161 RepID=UPI002271087F|nr:helix-turn-helix domain-containing protein [Pedobacter sp. SL55]WAC41635.1 helix-turn-helix domain-containing protein [Pedobacter sp. SL55]
MEKVTENKLQDYDMKVFMLNLVSDLKKEILTEISSMLKDKQVPDIKKWIKSVDVKKLLNISHGKLQTMRNSKLISYTRIGGTLYYNVDEIQRMLESPNRRR